MNFKKILCTALSAAAFTTSMNAFAAIPSDVAGTRYEEPVQVLNALKIMIGDDNGTFRLDETIIRSEVAKMAVHAMGLENIAASSVGNNDFLDVPADHWANGYIHAATSQGLIIGDGDGNFRPDDKITYAEAMTIFVRATGYNEAAKAKGGFPNGYMVTGSSAGLSDNVQCGTQEHISRGNVSFLTENALNAKLMEQTGFGANSKYEITDKTLLSDKLKVQKLDGQIKAVEGASIDGSAALSKNRIKIDDSVYQTSENFSNLLGFNVTYYVKENASNNDEVILAMAKKGQNSTIEIKADLFNKVTTRNSNTAIEYFKDENSSSTYTAEISSDAIMIYNGRKVDFNNDLLDLSNKEGSMVLLDTTKNGKHNIVFVNEYKNYVVEEVTANDKIVDKYNNGTLKLDDTVSFTIKKGFDEIKLSDLKEYDVLSVYASNDNSLYTIDVSSQSVEGKITAKDDKGIYVGDKHYKVAKNYTELLDINLEGTFYLDVSGKIAAVDTTSNLSSNYAYLLNAYTNNGTEVSSFKLYTKSGEEKVFDANEKIRFNDSTVTSKSAVATLNAGGSTKKQLVTFTENADGKLTGIKTAADNSGSGAINKDAFTLNYVLTDAVYDEELSKLSNVRIDDKTIIFSIPEGSTDYEIVDKSIFEDEQKYNAHVYDMTESYTARAIVLTNAALKANADSELAVVKKISTAINSDDEQTKMLTALVNGEEKKIYAKDDTVLVKGTKSLETGDLIQYKTNSKGEIVSVRVLFDISTKGTEAITEPVENLKTVYGKVTKKFSNSVNVTVNGASETNYSLSDKVKVYSVDTTLSNNNVELASAGEIQSFDAEEGNRIFLKLYKGAVTEAVIIK